MENGQFYEILLLFLIFPLFHPWLLIFLAIFWSKILSTATTFTEFNTAAISQIIMVESDKAACLNCLPNLNLHLVRVYKLVQQYISLQLALSPKQHVFGLCLNCLNMSCCNLVPRPFWLFNLIYNSQDIILKEMICKGMIDTIIL